MAGTHLGPPKSKTRAKSLPKWSPENRDQPQHQVPQEKEEEDPSAGALWIPC